MRLRGETPARGGTPSRRLRVEAALRAAALRAAASLRVAAVGLALLCAAPAAARADTYTPVVGAGSFNSAPILAPGSYRDTVLPEEYLYYAVRLQPGQRLHVSAASETDARTLLDLGVTFIKVNVASPDRTQILSDIDGTQEFAGDGDDPADFTTPEVAKIADQSESPTESWTGPGVYFVSVYAIYRGSDPQPPKAEIPFHFTLQVEGTAIPEASPTATATAKPKATATATPTPEVEAEGGGTSAGVAAGLGIGGLLIGALGGLALTRRGP
jgi:hypothetical protein